MSSLIHTFGREYGYKPMDFFALPITGTFMLIDRMKEQYEAMSGKGKKKGTMSIDQLRDKMRLG